MCWIINHTISIVDLGFGVSGNFSKIFYLLFGGWELSHKDTCEELGLFQTQKLIYSMPISTWCSTPRSGGSLAESNWDQEQQSPPYQIFLQVEHIGFYCKVFPRTWWYEEERQSENIVIIQCPGLNEIMLCLNITSPGCLFLALVTDKDISPREVLCLLLLFQLPILWTVCILK